MIEPRFPVGQLTMTRGALVELTRANTNPLQLISRHVSGDWGELDAFDKQQNENALQHDLRLLSKYRLSPTNEPVYVITEADRSYTTILLPEEY